MKAASSHSTPEHYIARLAEPRRSALQTLHNAIRKAAPALAPSIGCGMLAYGPFHYKYAGGREGDWWSVCLASQKNYISLHICAGDKHGYLAEANKHRLGKVSVAAVASGSRNSRT